MTIRELRDARKMSQSELAKDLGVNSSVIGHIEHGRMKLSPKIAAKAKELYGVELEQEEKMGETTMSEAKAAAKKPAAKKPALKKPALKKPAKKFANEVIIQTPEGGEITPAQILAKMPGDVDRVYVRIDQNKLWWVRGEETGVTDTWE